jgi:hypothetical protein
MYANKTASPLDEKGENSRTLMTDVKYEALTPFRHLV